MGSIATPSVSPTVDIQPSLHPTASSPPMRGVVKSTEGAIVKGSTPSGCISAKERAKHVSEASPPAKQPGTPAVVTSLSTPPRRSRASEREACAS